MWSAFEKTAAPVIARVWCACTVVRVVRNQGGVYLTGCGYGHLGDSQYRPQKDASLRLMEKCSVCLDSMIEVVTAPCGHTFCPACFDGCLTSTLTHPCCPNCRASIRSAARFIQIDRVTTTVLRLLRHQAQDEVRRACTCPACDNVYLEPVTVPSGQTWCKGCMQEQLGAFSNGAGLIAPNETIAPPIRRKIAAIKHSLKQNLLLTALIRQTLGRATGASERERRQIVRAHPITRAVRDRARWHRVEQTNRARHKVRHKAALARRALKREERAAQLAAIRVTTVQALQPLGQVELLQQLNVFRYVEGYMYEIRLCELHSREQRVAKLAELLQQQFGDNAIGDMSPEQLHSIMVQRKRRSVTAATSQRTEAVECISGARFNAAKGLREYLLVWVSGARTWSGYSTLLIRDNTSIHVSAELDDQAFVNIQ